MGNTNPANPVHDLLEAPSLQAMKDTLQIPQTPATVSEQGLMPASAVTKLAGIATGATANAPDAALRDRATHTGSQTIGSVTGLIPAINEALKRSEVIVSGGTARLRVRTYPPQYLTWNVTVGTPDTILFIQTGESNSGGYALNSDLPSWLLTPQTHVKILNNNSLAFESMQIGVNSLIGHAGLNADAATSHSWEAGIARACRAGEFSGLSGGVHIVKTGQGGSTIAQWAEDGAYWATFVTRVQAAIAALSVAGRVPWVAVLYTHGINDAIAGTDFTVFKNAIAAHLAKMRTLLGPVPVMLTELPAARAAYTAKLQELVDADANNYMIETGPYPGAAADGPLRDTNHWSVMGQDRIAARMVDAALTREAVTGRKTILFVPTANIKMDGGFIALGTGTASTGVYSVATIDATSAFEVITEWTGAETEGAVLSFRANNTDNLSWGGSGTPAISHFYHASGTGAIDENGFSPIIFTWEQATPCWAKAAKSGNDIVYSVSTDGGATWAVKYTHAGVLAGKTNIYMSCTFAIAGTTKRIRAFRAV